MRPTSLRRMLLASLAHSNQLRFAPVLLSMPIRHPTIGSVLLDRPLARPTAASILSFAAGPVDFEDDTENQLQTP